MNQDTVILSRIIAAWGWHLIGIMFFLRAISFYYIKDILWMGIMLGVFIVCEVIAYLRKGDIEDAE